jgi:hypothetical protein
MDTLALAHRALGADAAARLRQLHPDERQREFLRLWVRHEASLKCLGTGIGGSQAPVRTGGRAPWIAELGIGDGGAAAVALDAEPAEVRCWEWRRP